MSESLASSPLVRLLPQAGVIHKLPELCHLALNVLMKCIARQGELE